MTADAAIGALGARVSADAKDVAARYELAVLLLDSRGLFPVDDDALLEQIEQLLAQAVKLDATNAAAQAALGYTYVQLGRFPKALEHFQAADRLAPKNKTVEVYVATLLADVGREKEALKAIEAIAPRHRANLKKLRAELAKANFPQDAQSLLMNGFLHPRNFFRSHLSDEAERIRNALDRGRKRRTAKEQLERCKQDQRELEASFDRRKVPAALRPLAAAASRYGIGDDYCRPLLMKKIPKKERDRLIRQADKLAKATDKWLDTFLEGQMTTEAAAFMYLLSGIEEIR